MLFHIFAKDKPGAIDLRLETREPHLEYVSATGEAVKIAGPILDDDGQLIGSVLIVDFPDQNAAEQWVALDPYTRAGLFESVEIHPWKWIIGAPDDLE